MGMWLPNMHCLGPNISTSDIIQGYELLNLGFEVVQSGVAKYMAPARAGEAGSSPAPVTLFEMVAKLSPEVRMLALGLMP